MTGHDSSQVSPFGHPRINARLPTPQGLSQAPTSFIGSWCQGIHHAPSVACHNNTTTNTSNHTQPPTSPTPAPHKQQGQTRDKSGTGHSHRHTHIMHKKHAQQMHYKTRTTPPATTNMTTSAARNKHAKTTALQKNYRNKDASRPLCSSQTTNPTHHRYAARHPPPTGGRGPTHHAQTMREPEQPHDPTGPRDPSGPNSVPAQQGQPPPDDPRNQRTPGTRQPTFHIQTHPLRPPTPQRGQCNHTVRAP